jgi:trehalose/maltose hydrolase-like predicted phosphorylase
VYDGDGPQTDLLAAPRWALLGRALDAHDRDRRVLDLHTATLGEHADGGTRLESLRFVSLAHPGIAVLRADVEPPDDSPPLVPSAAAHTTGVDDGRAWIATRGTGGSVTAAASQARDGHRLLRLAAYVTSPGGPEPEREAPAPEEAVSALEQAERAGFESLLVEHRRAWALRWAHADVQIVGDAALQSATRVALFHLMGSAGDRGESAVGARGLTGRAYRGHVFWDADLFVLPFLVATHPPAARAMLEYRIRRLPAALRLALGEGHEGARFPWESAASGVDVTPRAGRDPSGVMVPIRTGENEIHIVGDVAWASCFYADWTGDEEFAAGPGFHLLVATARYWASRVRTDHDGRAHLYGVIGPDEYHEPVDDNAYTNVLARWNLRRAAAAATRYGDHDVDDRERARWLALADALVDGYDPATGVYEEFAGFYDLEPILIADVAPRRPISADLLLGRDRVRNSQVVKQADVLMLHHLLFDETAPDSLVPNLDYYEPRTAHGSSLSPAIHASVLARAGRLDDALAALRVAAHIDLEDLTATAAGGVHLASMGGVWQAFAFGFMGLRAQGDALAVDPRLPRQWRSLEVRVQFHGVVMSLRVEPDLLRVHADRGVAIQLRGQRIDCEAGDNTLRLGEPATR